MQYQRFNPKDFEGKLISEYSSTERIQYNAFMSKMKKVLQIDEKYKNCIIYRLSIPGDRGSYIGHTVNRRNREILHKHCTKNYKSVTTNKKLYSAIHEAGGWEVVHFELLESLPNCRNKLEAEAAEAKWCDRLQPTLNTSPVRYHPEYNFGF